MKEISKAFTKVFVQGILDYKLMFLKGTLYWFMGFLPVFAAQLKEYHDKAALGDLEWQIIWCISIYQANVNLMAYLSKDSAAIEKRIELRNGSQPQFHKEVAKNEFETQIIAKDKQNEKTN